MKKSLLLDVSENVPLNIRLYNFICMAGLVSSFFALVFTIISRLQFISTIASLSCFLIMLAFYFYTVKYNKSHRGALFLSTMFNGILFPIIFITTGGIDGGMPLYFILGLFLSVLILHGKHRVYLLILFIILDICLIVFGYFYPEYIVPFETRVSRLFEIVFSFLIVSISTCVVLIVLIKQYTIEQKKVEKLNRNLKELSIKDPLTNLYNRRYFHEILDVHIKDAEATNSPLSLAFFDIDCYKEINDTYGHLVGDVVLKSISEILVQTVNGNGIVSRFGGEEFVILFTNSDACNAFQISEEIRKKVYESKLSQIINEPISISGGIASYYQGMDSEQFLRIADNNLYKAKLNGKNQIVLE